MSTLATILLCIICAVALAIIIGSTIYSMRARRVAERDEFVRAVERDLLDDMRKSGLI